MAIADRIPVLKTAMARAGMTDDPSKVITMPHSLDTLIVQVKSAEQRVADAQARHGKEVASLTWQHQSEVKALDTRHAQERAGLEAELVRTQRMFLKALASHGLGIDVDALGVTLEAEAQ